MDAKTSPLLVTEPVPLHTLADALHRVADLAAAGRVTVQADGWNIAAYDYLHLAEQIVDAMDVTVTKLWRGDVLRRDCCTVIGTLAGHPVRLSYTIDDLDWHGPKVGEPTSAQVAEAALTPDSASAS